MKNCKKRLLAAALSLCITVGFVPAQAVEDKISPALPVTVVPEGIPSEEMSAFPLLQSAAPESETEPDVIPYSAVPASVTLLSGYCGAEGNETNVSWVLDPVANTMTITGTGPMMDYDWGEEPWYDWAYSDYNNKQSTHFLDVKIGEGITEIYDLRYLKIHSLTLPSTLKKIGSSFSAQKKDYGSFELVLPAGLEFVAARAFQNWENISKLTIHCHDSVFQTETQFNEAYTFLSCRYLTEVSLPEGWTTIPNQMFCGCSRLTSVDIPDTVTHINDGAFKKCTQLATVDLPEGLTSIGGGAFRDCTALTSITFPDSLKDILGHAFYGCTALTEFNWPKAMLNGGSIGYNAFYNCQKLVGGHLTIPDNVTIGEQAFYNCDRITGITLPSSSTLMGKGVFNNCSGFTEVTIPEGWTKIPIEMFEFCNNLSSIHFPTTPIELGQSAFSWCESLTELTLPANVTKLHSEAFIACKKLKTLTIENPDLTYNGSAFFQQCESLTTVNFPDGMKEIGSGMFISCINLNNVTLPDSLTKIGTDAFMGCKSLTEIAIPSGVTELHYREFEDCTSLKKVTFPDTIRYIGYESFVGCTALKQLVIPASVTKISNNAFYSRFRDSVPLQIRFLGDAPEIDCEGYYTTEPPFPDTVSIYYTAGKAGWTTPKWSEFDYDTYPILGQPEFHDSEEAYYAPVDLYHFSFQSGDTPVDSVTVSYMGSSMNCEAGQSELTVGMSPVSGEYITFSREGYHDVVLPAEVLDNFNTIQLFSTRETLPFIQAVYARHPNTIRYSDLINGSFSFKSGSTTQTTQFYIDINWNGSTPEKVFISPTLVPGDGWELGEDFYDAGYLSLNMHSGDDLYLLVGSDTTVHRAVKLSTFIAPAKLDQKITIGENTGSTFSPTDNGTNDATAFLSQFDFGFEFFDMLQMQVEVQRDGTVKGLLGVSLKEDMSDEFDSIYGSIKDGLAYNSDDLTDVMQARETLQSLLSNRGAGWTLGKCSLATEGEFSVFGYAEGKVVIGSSGTPELHFYEGAVGVTIGGKVEQVFQLYLNGVPVYFSGALANSTSFTIPVATNYDLGPGLVPAFRLLKLQNDFEMKLAAGLGWDSILSAGVYGKGNLILTGYIPFKFSESSMKGTSSFGLEINVFTVFKTDVEIFRGKDIYLWGEENASSFAARRLSQLDWQSVSRDYLYTQANTPQLFTVDESNTALTRTQLDEDGIYPGADVRFISSGDYTYAVWTDDPGESVRPEANNRTKLYYSRRYKTNGRWTSPSPVVDFYWDDDDGTADFNPVLKELDGTVYVLWQNANRPLTAHDSVDTLPGTMDICCSVLESGNVLATVGTEYYDTAADITLIDGTPYVVWASNSSNSAFGGEGTYSIHRQAVIPYTETETETLITGLNTVDSLVADGSAVWYSTDTNIDSNSISDYAVFYFDGQSTKQISNPGATKPALVNGTMTWYENGAVRLGDELIPLATDTDRYQYLVSSTGLEAIVYTVDSDMRQTTLYASFNDGSGWGNPITLSGISGNVSSFSAGFDSTGTMYVLTCERTLDPDSSNYLLGTANLNLYCVTPYADISITNATYLRQSLVRGGHLDLVIDVVNNGMSAANILQVAAYNGDLPLNSAAFEQFLPSGHSAQVYISVPLEDPAALDDLKVAVYAGGYAERTPDDNEAFVTLKLSDISLEGSYLTGSGENLTARTMLVNRGQTVLHDITVALCAEDGETVLAAQSFDVLNCGDGKIISFPVTPGTETQLLTIQASAAGLDISQENLIANNKVTIRVDGSGTESLPVSVTASAVRNKDGSVSVAAYITDTEERVAGIHIAGYTSTGRMVDVVTSSSGFLGGTLTGDEIDKVLLFMLDQNLCPVSEVIECTII